jgi:hypothetical protein
VTGRTRGCATHVQASFPLVYEPICQNRIAVSQTSPHPLLPQVIDRDSTPTWSSPDHADRERRRGPTQQRCESPPPLPWPWIPAPPSHLSCAVAAQALDEHLLFPARTSGGSPSSGRPRSGCARRIADEEARFVASGGSGGHCRAWLPVYCTIVYLCAFRACAMSSFCRVVGVRCHHK